MFFRAPGTEQQGFAATVPGLQGAMTLEAIRAALEGADYPPADILRAAGAQAAALAPAIIAVVERGARGEALTEAEGRLLVTGIHVLGAAGWTGLYRPLLRLVARPDCEDRLGDATTESLPGLMLGIFDGDPAPLFAAIEDSSVDGAVRWSLLSALAKLTNEARIPRAQTVALLDRFDRERLATSDDLVWSGWQDAVLWLGLTDWKERVLAMWADDRRTALIDDAADWEQRLAAMTADPAAALAADPHYQRIERYPDAAEALLWAAPRPDGEDTEGDDDELLPPPTDGNFTPEDGPALTPGEQFWIDDVLRSPFGPKYLVSFEMLDGFVCAMGLGTGDRLSGRDLVQAMWTSYEGTPPALPDPALEEYAARLVERHRDAVLAAWTHGRVHQPVRDEDGPGLPGEAWACGFVLGIDVEESGWGALLDYKRIADAVQPVIALGEDESSTDIEPLSRKDRRSISENLGRTLLSLHGLTLLSPEELAGTPVKRTGPKIGRNDPCPCGSGKKYKKCCGADAG